MSYYRIKDNDLFINTIEAYPDVKFYIQSGSIYIDDESYISGSHSNNILGVPRNYMSLYGYNINRSNEQSIYPFVIKDGTKSSFKSITKLTYNTNYALGEEISSSYNLSASITRFYITGNANQTYPDGPPPTRADPSTHWKKSNGITVLGRNSDPELDFVRTNVYYLRALKNTIEYYKYLSPHYDFATITKDNTVNMITIPSIFYGSKIKKGSVNLKYYITGTLAAQASDYRMNGELVQVSGSTTGSVVGVVLYNEGFLLLSSSAAIDGNSLNYESLAQSSWVRFGYGANDDTTNFIAGNRSPMSASFAIEFKGTNHIQAMTMLCKAPEGEINHSNNPTYLDNLTKSWEANSSGSNQYLERTRHIKNVVSASYNDIDPPFEKETYISKIALYDKEKNVIGFAKLATPVRKTEAREFIFKLKLDL